MNCSQARLLLEAYADGELDRNRGQFRIRFQAADHQLGTNSAGAPFHVHAPGGYLPDDAASYTDAPVPLERSRRWSFWRS